MPNPIYICGPTASGKSSLAIALAHTLDGEVINADAYQLYRSIETIAATPSADELAQAPHHLYGVLDPTELCDAMRYREMALPVIAEVQSRKKTPIVTGGSGMYLKFLTHGVSPVPSGDDQLRAELERETDDSLIAKLKQLDPEGAAITNLQNRRYLIRALEICILSGKPMSQIKNDWKQTSAKREKNLQGAYLLWDRETLRHRIDQRTRIMLESGAIEEIQNLTTMSATCAKAIGIPQIRAHLAGETNLEECSTLIATATKQYAKRQRTWFKKEQWLSNFQMDESTDLTKMTNTIVANLRA